jgi:hypothetical protein
MALFRTTKIRCFLTICLSLLSGIVIRADDKPTLPKLLGPTEITATEQIITTTDISGIAHNSIAWKGYTVVLVFIGLECPVANAYAPEVMSQKNASKDDKVLWLGVHSEPGVTKEAATKHAEDYKMTLPILLDSEQKLAAAVGAKKLGQVVVLQDLQVVYRGRIDDRFALNGKRRDEPSTHELRDVLAALAENKPVPVAETEAYGCPIPFKK